MENGGTETIKTKTIKTKTTHREDQMVLLKVKRGPKKSRDAASLRQYWKHSSFYFLSSKSIHFFRLTFDSDYIHFFLEEQPYSDISSSSLTGISYSHLLILQEHLTH